MKFRFCGGADCPDWVLAEINTLSRLSSVKLKLLSQVVVKAILKPPIDISKAEKLFSDSKLDSDMELKACISCIFFIISSTVRYNCNSTALHSELQQLGLPREHSTSIKRVLDSQFDDLTSHFRKQSLQINSLNEAMADVDQATNCIVFDLDINGKAHDKVTLIPYTAEVLLQNLKQAREKMLLLNEQPTILM